MSERRERKKESKKKELKTQNSKNSRLRHFHRFLLVRNGDEPAEDVIADKGRG